MDNFHISDFGIGEAFEIVGWPVMTIMRGTVAVEDGNEPRRPVAASGSRGRLTGRSPAGRLDSPGRVSTVMIYRGESSFAPMCFASDPGTRTGKTAPGVGEGVGELGSAEDGGVDPVWLVMRHGVTRCSVEPRDKG